LVPLVCILATTALFFAVLVEVRPLIDIRGTRTLAIEAAALAQPGDRIYHYHDFFHDFTFYARRTVGLVGYHGELEPENDDPATVSEVFVTDPEFRRQWEGRDRIFVVAGKSAVRELFADPAFHYRLLGEDQGHYLFSNR
jgi:hypothetical protein